MRHCSRQVLLFDMNVTDIFRYQLMFYRLEMQHACSVAVATRLLETPPYSLMLNVSEN